MVMVRFALVGAKMAAGMKRTLKAYLRLRFPTAVAKVIEFRGEVA
jgi:hypothetical protein